MYINKMYNVTSSDTKLTKFRRTETPAVHVGQIAVIICAAAGTVVVRGVVEVRDENVICPVI